jgi:hypothetical protein
MATTPHPAPPPPKPAAPANNAKTEAPPPVETVADEQRARSAEIEKMGVENWKAAHDNRTPEERPKLGVTVAKHA